MAHVGKKWVGLDAATKRMHEFWPPGTMDPYMDSHSVVPDKTGEVWAGEWLGRELLRLTPRTGQRTQSAMPEPCSHSRNVCIDDSLPVLPAVWHGGHNAGRFVRIQPLE